MTLQNEQDAIKQAIEAGWDSFASMGELKPSDYPEIALQDPAFWRALGKARGWGGKEDGLRLLRSDTDASITDCEEYLEHALEYFRVLLSKGDLEKYWQNLP